VQNVADILVDPEGALERRNHWENEQHKRPSETTLQVMMVRCISEIVRTPSSHRPHVAAVASLTK
jgi:hypothetical protein